MNVKALRALTMLGIALIVGLLVGGCQDDGSSPTGATSTAADGVRLQTTALSASSDDDDSEEDESDDSSSDDDSDDEGEDDDSEDDADDDSEDDDSEDDDSADEGEEGDEGNSEVRGLFFGSEACPTVDCLAALRIKDTLVVVTSGTEVVNEPAGEALVPPSDLLALVGTHLGLPMRAEGSSDGGVLIAQKLRIDDEIHASGDVVPGALGCDFGLAVNGVELCFVLSPGLTPPAIGTAVRVEGATPSDLSLPFVATEIEPADG
jgi:hypothetical protein